jgi:hypothetical protein
LEEVVAHADREVLMEIENNSVMIVGDPQGILGLHLRLYPIHLSNFIVIILNCYTSTNPPQRPFCRTKTYA